ncbi:hypothetical protein KGF54_003748 [Candida jiufengensis]|uniref:uncharacterized protein n=1 Tax=Candida jiufengensis TaxID=497108 RepID=UPI0022252EC2|nr:uncharacterized protein KGF54_003748 [Candida jiufengensis]KAI5952881.1 hypothetical protein KGF54_003748 [Candida jiufengensis]
MFSISFLKFNYNHNNYSLLFSFLLLINLITFTNAEYYPAAKLVGCYSSISNTNSQSQGNYNFQSSGYCSHNSCPNSMYVAIKGEECICLNNLPNSNTKLSDSNCNVPCAGYDSEMCGGSSSYSIFFGVNNNNNAVIVSQGSSSSPSSSSPSGTANSNNANAASSSTNQQQSTSNTGTTTETTAQATSQTQERVTSTVTSSDNNGSVLYKTITQTDDSTETHSSSSSTTSETSSSTTNDSSNTTNSNSESKNNNNHKKSVAPIVGGVVGGVIGAALIGLLAFFIIRKRNAYDDDDYDDEEEFYDDKNKNSNKSYYNNANFTNNNNGNNLGSGSNGSFKYSRKNSKKTNNTKISPLDMPMVNPFQHPNDDLVSGSKSGNRNSLFGLGRLKTSNGGFIDPRLNPIMMGRRRLSEGSLADEADYSRKVLQVANPE